MSTTRAAAARPLLAIALGVAVGLSPALAAAQDYSATIRRLQDDYRACRDRESRMESAATAAYGSTCSRILDQIQQWREMQARSSYGSPRNGGAYGDPDYGRMTEEQIRELNERRAADREEAERTRKAIGSLFDYHREQANKTYRRGLYGS